jgi:microcystin-dependent protein
VTKHRDLTKNVDTIPESWVDALSEFIGTMATPFRLELATLTSLRIAAGVDNAQVSIGINGRWRYINATVTAAHPGGPAGEHAVYVTASDNSFGVGEVDNTVYAFGLEIRASGTPTTALYRQIGTVVWNGAAITEIRQTVGAAQYEPARMPPGSITAYAGATVPGGWLLCDGRTLNRADYPQLAEALGVPAQQATFAVPNLLGRVPVGRDAGQGEFATLLQANLGAKTVALTTDQMPRHDHGGATGAQNTHGQSTGHLHNVWTTGAGGHNHGPDGGEWFARTVGTAPGLGSGGTARYIISGYSGYTSWVGDHAHGMGIDWSDRDHSHYMPPMAIGRQGGGIDQLGHANAHANLQPYTVVNFIVKT